MEKITINHRVHGFIEVDNLFNVIISGNYLMITTKESFNNGDNDINLITSTIIYHLKDVVSYTSVTKTTKYENYGNQ